MEFSFHNGLDLELKDKEQKMSSRIIRAYINSSMTKKEIVAAIKKQPNGCYSFKICIGCGAYFISPDENIENAKFLENCKECFTPKEFVFES